MIYDELIGEIYWGIGKIQSDPELEEELYRLNFDIRKNGLKVPGDSYVMNEEIDARIEMNQVISELERIANLAKESDIRQYLFEIKAELEIEGIIEEYRLNKQLIGTDRGGFAKQKSSVVLCLFMDGASRP